MTKNMTTAEACNALGIGCNYLRDLLWSGKLRGAVKRDGEWVIPVGAVEARKKHMQERRAGAESRLAARRAK